MYNDLLYFLLKIVVKIICSFKLTQMKNHAWRVVKKMSGPYDANGI